MFKEYYMFCKETDEKLKELGFELDKDELVYKKICYDLDMIVRYEINENFVNVSRLNHPKGCRSSRHIKSLRSYTFNHIIGTLESALNDLNQSYCREIILDDLKELKNKQVARIVEVSDSNILDVKNRLESLNFKVKHIVKNSEIKSDKVIKVYW